MRDDCTEDQVRDEGTGQCIDKGGAKEPPPPPELCTGNPMNAGTGSKHEFQAVYAGAGGSPLSYGLTYMTRGSASLSRVSKAHGWYWVSTYDRRLNPSLDGTGTTGPSVVYVSRPTGQLLGYRRQPSGSYLPDADLSDQLVRLADASGGTVGWRLATVAGELETYDATGKLLSIADVSGRVQTLAYDAQGRLSGVADGFGRSLAFSYDAQHRIVALIQPDGGVVTFAYDGANNLSAITWPDGQGRTYLYEQPYRPNFLTGITDENGARFATWSYDVEGRAVSSEHAGGAEKVTLAYGAGSTTVTDALGTVRTKNLTTILGVVRGTGESQPGGSGCGPASSALAYDSNGNVASRTDFNGAVTTYTYDLTRNLETARVEAAGKPEARTVSTQWHGVWRQPVKVAEPKKVTTYVYNGDTFDGSAVTCAPAAATVPVGTGTQPIGVLCRRIEQATNDGNGSQGFSAVAVGTPRVWNYTYNQSGQVLTADGPRTDVSDVTTTTYYEAADPDSGKRGNLATIANALGQVTSITAYDLNGRPLMIVDPNGVATTLSYDARGRLVSRTVGNETTAYAYDGVGPLTKVTLPDGSAVSYAYDAAHRLTAVSDGLGNTVTYTLDALGNRVKEAVKDPGGQLARTRSRVFDALNRLMQDIGAQGQATAYEYDPNGNRTKVTDPLNRSTVSAFDALNRLITVTDPGAGVTRYGWDGQDRLASVTDPRHLVTAYTVDGLGNRGRLHSPDTGTTVSTFDAAGNEVTRTDAKGQITAFAYDALNRLTRATDHDGKETVYAWDTGANGVGRLGRIDEIQNGQPVGSLAYAYDPLGRVVAQTRTVGMLTQTVGYAYAGGRLTGITYPSGRTLSYDRDGAGRIARVTLTDAGQATVLAESIAYAPFGGVTGWTDGAGQAHARTYDGDGRVSSYTLGGLPWLLSYDGAGRIAGQMDGGDAQRSGLYDYDALDRLTGAVLPNSTYGYGYDAAGNRTRQDTGGGSRAYTVDPMSNRLLGVTTAPPTAYAHDPNGSVTGDGAAQYAYDAQGRLNRAATAAGTTAYQVNALGQRVRKTGPGGDTVFAYDLAGRLIAEAAPDGTAAKEYYWLDDTPIAVRQ